MSILRRITQGSVAGLFGGLGVAFWEGVNTKGMAPECVGSTTERLKEYTETVFTVCVFHRAYQKNMECL